MVVGYTMTTMAKTLTIQIIIDTKEILILLNGRIQTISIIIIQVLS